MTIIKAIQEVLNTDDVVIFETKDGTNIHITPENAESIVNVHDSLNKTNQQKMRSLMENSDEDYIRILNFCENQDTNEEE